MPALPAEPATERLPELAPWLKDKLLRKGHLLKDAAEKVASELSGVSEEHVRLSFPINKFSPPELEKLLALAGCEEFCGEGGLEKLRKSYSFETVRRRPRAVLEKTPRKNLYAWPGVQHQVTALSQAIKCIEQPVIDKNQRDRSFRDPVVHALESLFSAMGEHDVYCHLSLSTLATEFCMSRLTRRMIGEGVMRGATYIYAYPARDLGDDEASRSVLDERARIVEAVVSDMKKTFIEIRKIDEERVNAQILLLPVSAPILTPGVEYLLYQTYMHEEKTFDTPKAMMIVPLAGRGHEGDRVLLPLSLPMAGMLLGVLSDAMALSGLPQREPSPWLFSSQNPPRMPAITRVLSHPPP